MDGTCNFIILKMARETRLYILASYMYTLLLVIAIPCANTLEFNGQSPVQFY